jgi:FKBP-type peptidyl-prolyl cis-trans isomerase
MQTRALIGLAVLGLSLCNSEVTLSADDKDEKEDSKDKKEVAFPELPKGAGKIDKDAPKTFSETKSGLKYRILRKGEGKKPKSTDKVEVNYQGWLDNGKVFDSSYKRKESISFGLNQVIKGWTEGMQLVGEGGMIELEIPYDLGYGTRGSPPDIPPKATLHFLVELLGVK